MAELPVTPEDVLAAAERLAGTATRTGLLRSVELDRATGARVYVKPECLQLTGSFKFRGAYNRISAMSEEERERGVVAFSSGNHGQAVALAASMHDMRATIVMPADAPRIKTEKTRSHGAKIVTFDRATEDREEIAKGIAADTGAVLVRSYDDPYIIAGQGTSGLEVAEQLRDLNDPADVYVVCAGGGGLMAGSSLAFSLISPKSRIFSVEPVGHDDHRRSFEVGKRVRNEPDAPESICDALLVDTPGEMTFAVNRRFAAGGAAVTDGQVKQAMRFAFANLKTVAEPSGAAPLAAVLSGKLDIRGKCVALIISGGNVDPPVFAEILTG